MHGLYNILSNLSKHIALITIAGSIFVFFSSYFYGIFFFKKIDMPNNTLSLPLTFFSRPIIASVLTIFSILFMAFIIYMNSAFLMYMDFIFHSSHERINTKLIQGNILVWASYIMFIFLLLSFGGLFFMQNHMLLFSGLITSPFLLLILEMILPRKSKYYRRYTYFYIKAHRSIKVLFIIMAIMLYFSALASLGSHDSENIIKGQSGSYEVQLDLVEHNSDLENKTLILLMHYNNNIYLVEKRGQGQDIHNHTAEVYIIPEHSLKSAIIRKVPWPSPYLSNMHTIEGIINRWWWSI